MMVCVVGITSLQAQRNIGVGHNIKKPTFKLSGSTTNGIEGAGCDTVNYPFPTNWNLNYYFTNYGFLSGTNEYNTKEQADYFDLSATNDGFISGFAVYFIVANSTTQADYSKFIRFKIYADDNGQPGAQIGTTDSVTLSDIATDVSDSVISSFGLPTPVALPASKKFYVSVDLSNFSLTDGDSIAIVSTSIGDLAEGTGTAWVKLEDGTWANYNQVWPINETTFFDATLVILPFVSTTEGACGILPVKLISFDAARQNKDAIINWKVAEESNMKGYQLEKADNNNNYKPVTFIQAHNDYKNNNYSYTDANAFANASTIQYRLKQIDNDGKVQYSKIVSLKSSAAVNNVVFANPFNGSLRLQLNLASPSKISISIYDMKGNLVGSEKPSLYSATSNSIDVKSSTTLKSGMYVLKVIAGDEQYNYKIIKQ